MYTSNISEKKLWVGVYVDDLIITGSNPEEIESFKISMNKKFEMTDFGLLNSYLGIQIMQEEEEIKMCQTCYAIKILENFKMLDANGMQIEVKPRRRGIRGGIYVVQKDDWVFKVSHLNTT